MQHETLTKEEREDVEALPRRQPGCPVHDCLACAHNARRTAALAKLLRIHDAQAARIAALEKQAEHLRSEVLELACAYADLDAEHKRQMRCVKDADFVLADGSRWLEKASEGRYIVERALSFLRGHCGLPLGPKY